MKHSETETPAAISDGEKEIIESLLSYPALEKAFDSTAPPGRSGIRQKMLLTIADLERVIRRGTRVDAERAAKIVAAYRTAINFLEELDRRRQNQLG